MQENQSEDYCSGLSFLNNQCKDIEENNRMGKTRDSFNKNRDTKGTLHAKMSTKKDRNGMDLKEGEDIKKKWQEYTEELYKKDFNDPNGLTSVFKMAIPYNTQLFQCESKSRLLHLPLGR